MTTEEIVNIIEALPEEKQREVRDFAEFITRKERQQSRRMHKQPAQSSQRADAMFWTPSPSVEVLAAQQGIQPIRNIDEFVETIQQWRQEGTTTEDQP